MRLKTKQFECWIERPDGSRFLVRELTTSKQKELAARNKDNFTGYVVDAYSYQFRDWSGVKDEDGNPFPFNRENLSVAIEQDLDTLNLVMQTFRGRREEHEAAIKSAERD